MYDSLKIANEKAPQLQLEETLQLLETKYENLLEDHEEFKQLNYEKYVPQKLISQGKSAFEQRLEIEGDKESE